MDHDQPAPILVTCAKSLAPALAQEVEALGYRVRSSHETGVVTAGRMADAMRLNLHLRTAFNVLYLIKQFKARTPERLYNKVQTIDWDDIIAPDGYLSVVARTNTAAIDNTMFAAVKVKDAIVDQIAAHDGWRPDSGPDRTGVVVHLYWNDDACWLYLNTSGRKLADRSYRKNPYRAPMRETLAAGVLMTLGYDGAQPLVNPMCGSGTLAIEAAMIATGRAPGLLREDFGLLKIRGADRETWQRLREEAFRGQRRNLTHRIIASDIDPKAIAAAKQNARDAGVDRFIEFHVGDFARTPIPELSDADPPGIVVMNPEYGRRLGDEGGLANTYGRIGDFLKQCCPGWRAGIFTASGELTKRIGLRPTRRVRFFNADIECRLLEYELYEGTRRGADRPNPQIQRSTSPPV